MFDKWIDANEPSPAEKEEQRAKSATFDHRPLISVVMPVWNTPPMMLDRAIKSVMDQTYDKWEFCIADGNSNPKTKRILTTWAEKDRRIKIKFLSGNMGIAVNLNEALSLAQGEFVAFLDHDDIIAPFALFEIVSQLQFSKDADIIYSDEDKTDEEERRFGAFFKPDFSPDYLVGVNYIPHFLVVRKSLGDQIAWFREGYEGAQDYDLILRLVEKTGSIAHIPKILYHWRIWDRSTAGSIDAKPYANTSGKKALQEHLNRIGLSAHVADGYAPTFYRAQYDIVKTPLISIIIASRNNASNLERCIGSIIKNTTYTNFEIVLIENGRKEKEIIELNKKMKEDSRFHILHWQKPYNISRLNNWATKHARGEIFLFLNDNTQVINKDWLEQMLQFAVRPDVGGVGAKLYYPDGTIQHGGIIIGINGIAGYSHRHFPPNDPGYFLQLVLPHNVSAVAATCLMIRRKVFQEVSGFDKNFSFAFGDVDLCLRILQKGYLNVWTPYAELTLYEADPLASGLAIGSPSKVGKEREYFLRTWTNFIIRGDPYYNPNLTLESEDYSLNTSNLHKDSRSP
jgi:glycosyltransferase involved in cell wall biosynthesis